MRIWTLLLVATLALAGCLSEDDPDPTDDGMGDGDVPDPTPLPDDIHDSRLIPVGLDVQNQQGLMPPCALPTNMCVIYPFTLHGPAILDAALTWTVPTNDFDLYLYKGTDQVAVAGDFPPETEEAFTAQLTAGDYELWVVPWAVVGDTYMLDAMFS